MKPIDSTAEILALRLLRRTIDKKFVDWAYEMLLAGFETESLLMLAGETEPYYYFEIEKLVDNALQELGLSWDDREVVILNYVCYLVKGALAGTYNISKTLSMLQHLYLELDYDKLLLDFYLLYHAKDEANDLGTQWYWPDVDRDTIDEVILSYFKNWAERCKGV